MNKRTLDIDANLKTDKAKAGLRELESVGNKTAKNVENDFKHLGNTMTASFLKADIIKDVLYSMGRAALQFGKDVFEGGLEAERATTKLTTTLKNIGQYTEANVKDFEKWATGILRATNISDEAVMELASKLGDLTRLGGDSLQKLTKATLSYAELTDKSAESVALKMAKWANTKNWSLLEKQLGLTKGSIKDLDDVLEAVAGGWSRLEAKASDIPGKLKAMTIGWDELKEAMGSFVVESPAIPYVLDKINTRLNGFIDNILKLGDDSKYAFSDRFSWLDFSELDAALKANEFNTSPLKAYIDSAFVAVDALVKRLEDWQRLSYLLSDPYAMGWSMSVKEGSAPTYQDEQTLTNEGYSQKQIDMIYNYNRAATAKANQAIIDQNETDRSRVIQSVETTYSSMNSVYSKYLAELQSDNKEGIGSLIDEFANNEGAFKDAFNLAFAGLPGVTSEVVQKALAIIANFAKQVIGKFSFLYDILYGHSIWPDLWQGIYDVTVDYTGKISDKTDIFTSNISNDFRTLGVDVRDSFSSMLSDIDGLMNQSIEREQAYQDKIASLREGKKKKLTAKEQEIANYEQSIKDEKAYQSQLGIYSDIMGFRASEEEQSKEDTISPFREYDKNLNEYNESIGNTTAALSNLEQVASDYYDLFKAQGIELNTQQLQDIIFRGYINASDLVTEGGNAVLTALNSLAAQIGNIKINVNIDARLQAFQQGIADYSASMAGDRNSFYNSLQNTPTNDLTSINDIANIFNGPTPTVPTQYIGKACGDNGCFNVDTRTGQPIGGTTGSQPFGSYSGGPRLLGGASAGGAGG
jgi:hypothetical protein